jgi:Ca2+-binding RTX toxin-like protein
MEGGEGNDAYVVDHSGDQIVEHDGGGIDEVYFTVGEYALPEEVENGRYNSYSGDASVSGNTLANVIWGNSGNDYMSGMAGDDELRGSGGADTLNGDDGDDLLVGGPGGDTLDGGLGLDMIRIGYWEAGVGSEADIVNNFEQGSDKVDVSGWDADINTGGNQAFTWIGSAAFSGAAGEMRYWTDGFSTTTVEADYDGDEIADFEIVFAGDLPLTAADFIL